MAPEQVEEPARTRARVIAVVVTYRREELLLRCIDAIAGQTRPPEQTLVIDNGGIARGVLGGDRPGVTVIEPGENLGPAGGYALGFTEALAAGGDAIWTVDDDVVPAPECLERLVAARAAGAKVAVPLQRKPGGVRGFPPSWNGPLFDAGVVREVGVPRADLFFWAEDTEYVARLRASGHRRTHVPEAEVLHLNPGARRRGQARDYQLYYEVRNTLEYRLRIRRRTVKGVARAVGGVLGKLASILLLEPGKGRSLRLWWSGVRDFRRGRLGRVALTGDPRGRHPRRRGSIDRMFDGFELREIDVGDVTLRVRIGGAGPPVLLLHGHPQTHAMWHRVAPMLVAHHTVVAADLRGYGGSTSPPDADDPASFSKRAMARDQRALMEWLGFERFAVVGHDRGGRAAYRLALDHPEHVTRLAVLDIVPTADMWRFAEGAGKEFGLEDWHWYFLAQPAPRPERIIGADPSAYYFAGDTSRFDPEALADYRAAVADPGTIHAICQDYRAGATIDDELDEADRTAGRRIGCPVLALWSSTGELPAWFDVIAVWRGWADDVDGHGIDAGHFLAEEAPDEVATALLAFLDAAG